MSDTAIETLKTFDEWQEEGARIKAGSRAVAHRDGVALFSNLQVWYPAKEVAEENDRAEESDEQGRPF